MSTKRIYVAQAQLSLGALEDNLRTIIYHIKAAKRAHAQVAVFPRLALTGYQPLDLLRNHDFSEECKRCINKITLECTDIVAILGMPTTKHGLIYDSAAILCDGSIVGIELGEVLSVLTPDAPETKQQLSLAPQPPTLYSINGLSFLVSINNKMHKQPELYQKHSVPNCLFNLDARPYYYGGLENNISKLQQAASSLKTTILSTNLVGASDSLVFAGTSCVIDAQGRVTRCAPYFKEEGFFVDLDCTPCKLTSEHSFIRLEIPQMKSNGELIELPKELTCPTELPTLPRQAQELEAIAIGLRSYLQQNGMSDVVLGVSGGIDSALCAAIAVYALGSEHVHGIFLPSCFSSELSANTAQALCDNLQIETHTLPIEGPRAAFTELLAPIFANSKADLTEENLQARIRANILMALSNKFGWLLLSTGNKSEAACGYSTIYGDGAGGIAPIEDLYKGEVYQLSRYINAHVEINGRLNVIPEETITRPPSAELRPNQKDSDSLPDYPTLDAILYQYIEEERSVKEIIELGYAPDVVRRAARLMKIAEFKRRQGPLAIKLSCKLLGIDRQVPQTHMFKEYDF